MKISAKQIKKIGNIFYGFIFVFLILVALLVAISGLKFPGNYKIFSVQSGSMEPAIKTGSIVVVKPSDNYDKGDVITVKDSLNPKNTLTHRIFNVINNSGNVFYVTKGDANNAPDSEERPKANVLGKVIFTVPFIGYLISFAKTKEGLLILIIIPATIIIYGELLTIKREAQRLIKEKKERKLSMGESFEVAVGEKEIITEKWYKNLFKNIFILFFAVSISVLGLTKAFLSDKEVAGVSITAGTWGNEPSVITDSLSASSDSPEVNPTDTPTPEPTITPAPEALPTETPIASPEPSAEAGTPTPTPNEQL